MQAVNTNTDPVRRGRLVVVAVVLACAAVIVCLRLVAGDDPGSVLAVGDVPDVSTTVPPVTVPELPQPVDPSTLEDGWYLVAPTKILTTEDGPLLEAAQQIAVQARGVGYRDAKIIPSPGNGKECGNWGCSDGPGPMGYSVLLKGPFPVPNWTDSDADLDAKFAWHQQLQAEEQARAGTLGLVTTIGIALFTFSDG